MKCISWIIMSFLLLGVSAAHGQTSGPAEGSSDQVLAEGKPPLTRGAVDQLREVFEWLLDAKFSVEQRGLLQRQLVTEWRKADKKMLDTLTSFLDLRAQLANATEERRKAARDKMQPEFLRNLRQPPVDEMSKLLLAVYESAHDPLNEVSSSSPLREEAARNSSGGANRTGIPAELVGEWQARRGSGSSYYNPNTGSHGAPNATIDSYKFFTDGRYEHAILMQNSLYNCTIRVFGRETGDAAVEGDTLTITPGPGTLEYTDNCRPHLNSKKTTRMEVERWRWQVGRDEQGLKLCVRDQKGASACYYRQQAVRP